MNDRKEERQDDGARPGRDTVSAQGENQAPKARPPHEHDESVDSQAADSPSIDEMGRVAHRSVAAGHQDTSKGQETDATYERMRRDAEPAPQEPRNKTQGGR